MLIIPDNVDQNPKRAQHHQTIVAWCVAVRVCVETDKTLRRIPMPLRPHGWRVEGHASSIKFALCCVPGFRESTMTCRKPELASNRAESTARGSLPESCHSAASPRHLAASPSIRTRRLSIGRGSCTLCEAEVTKQSENTNEHPGRQNARRLTRERIFATAFA